MAIVLDDVRRVLVVRPNFRMGNLLLLTPGLTALRQRLPAARIDVISGGQYLSLLANNPDVDGMIRVDRHTFTPRALRRLSRYLRTAAYDLTIDGARGGSFLGATIVGLSRSRYRVGSSDSRYRRFFNVLVPTREGSAHKVELFLRVLEGIGVPPVSSGMKVALTEDEMREADALWSSIGIPLGRRTVGVNLSARGLKRVEADHMLAIVRSLQSDGFATVLFAGPEDAEALAELQIRMPAGSLVAPPLPIRRFAAMLARCDIVVTADTGPMHLAAAVGTATVTIVVDPRSTDYVPLGDQHRAVVGGDHTTVQDTLAVVRELVAHARRA
ncbi:MAG TPA: glycosyltransferase family 9 protein [Candidatus Binatia bacterium]|nr:glycosyltransferase family 9 protein [Candidatus Binatia bacterium]